MTVIYIPHCVSKSFECFGTTPMRAYSIMYPDKSVAAFMAPGKGVTYLKYIYIYML